MHLIAVTSRSSHQLAGYLQHPILKLQLLEYGCVLAI
jgi:hypothetical protein